MNMELVIYVFINVILIAIAVLAAKFWSVLGTFGGLIGAIMTLLVFQAPNLILQTVYDQTAQVFVQQTYPMGFFAWIPLVLTALNFIVALKK